jgi:hypothetical protein
MLSCIKSTICLNFCCTILTWLLLVHFTRNGKVIVAGSSGSECWSESVSLSARSRDMFTSSPMLASDCNSFEAGSVIIRTSHTVSHDLVVVGHYYTWQVRVLLSINGSNIIYVKNYSSLHCYWHFPSFFDS